MRVVQLTVIRAISVLSLFFAIAGFYFIGMNVVRRITSDTSNNHLQYVAVFYSAGCP